MSEIPEGERVKVSVRSLRITPGYEEVDDYPSKNNRTLGQYNCSKIFIFNKHPK